MSASHDSVNNKSEAITFRCEAGGAAKVCLIGDFNNWNAASHPMRREAGGSWALEVLLPQGRHHYQFLVDGRPVLDPHAMYRTLKNRNENVSFIAVD